MAKKPADAPTPAKYDPSVTYKVMLSRVVDTGRKKLKPRDEHEMSGAYLNDFITQYGEDAVDRADPVV